MRRRITSTVQNRALQNKAVQNPLSVSVQYQLERDRGSAVYRLFACHITDSAQCLSLHRIYQTSNSPVKALGGMHRITSHQTRGARDPGSVSVRPSVCITGGTLNIANRQQDTFHLLSASSP